MTEARQRADRSDGDPAKRFEAIYSEHAGAVLAFVLRRASIDVAPDIVAETFVVTWRKLDELPLNKALPWLYGTARRVLANYRRSQRRRDALVDRIASNTPALPEWTETSQESPLLEALASLPAAQQEVLMLAAWEGLDGRAASTALGCSPTAFRLRLFRARRNLEKRLQTNGSLGSPSRRPSEKTC